MKVYNPTNNTLTIQYKGIQYSVGPMSSIYNVPTNVAEHWKTSVHGFIEISNTSEELFVPKVEITPTKEVTTEETKEEVKEEPKKSYKSKK